MMAGAKWLDSVLPALAAIQVPARSMTSADWAAGPPAAPKAAQQSVVVLKLLTLRTVSPQPPSALTCSASHSRPLAIRMASLSVLRARLKMASAVIAVAVERALLESSPVQSPSALRASSNAVVALPSARAMRLLSIAAPFMMITRSSKRLSDSSSWAEGEALVWQADWLSRLRGMESRLQPAKMSNLPCPSEFARFDRLKPGLHTC